MLQQVQSLYLRRQNRKLTSSTTDWICRPNKNLFSSSDLKGKFTVEVYTSLFDNIFSYLKVYFDAYNLP